MSLEKSIKRVERYRDDLVTHGETAKAMTEVVDAARKWDHQTKTVISALQRPRHTGKED